MGNPLYGLSRNFVIILIARVAVLSIDVQHSKLWRQFML